MGLLFSCLCGVSSRRNRILRTERRRSTASRRISARNEAGRNQGLERLMSMRPGEKGVLPSLASCVRMVSSWSRFASCFSRGRASITRAPLASSIVSVNPKLFSVSEMDTGMRLSADGLLSCLSKAWSKFRNSGVRGARRGISAGKMRLPSTRLMRKPCISPRGVKKTRPSPLLNAVVPATTMLLPRISFTWPTGSPTDLGLSKAVMSRCRPCRKKSVKPRLKLLRRLARKV